MKGTDKNSFKIRTNAVCMPSGMFILHSFVMFYIGYEFCKHVVLHEIYDKCIKGEKDGESELGTDEE